LRLPDPETEWQLPDPAPFEVRPEHMWRFEPRRNLPPHLQLQSDRIREALRTAGAKPAED
jgi:hypothetical protein